MPRGIDRWLLVALVAASLVPRLVGLGDWLLSGDDVFHVQHALAPGALDSLAADTHPPLFYVLLRACVPFDAPFAFRVPALLFGALAVPVFYVVGQRTTGSRAGAWVCAVLAAAGVTLVLQSQVVRHYTLVVVLEGIAIVAFLDGRRAIYLPAAALLVATHYPAAILVAVLGVLGARAPGRWVWLAAHAALAAIWLLEVRAASPLLDAARIEQLPGGFLAPLRMAVSIVHLGEQPWDGVLLAPFVAGIALLAHRRAWRVLAIATVPLLVAWGLHLAGLLPLAQAPRWAAWLIPMTMIPTAVAVAAAIERWRAIAAVPMLAAFVWRAHLHDPDWMRRADEGSAHWTSRAEQEELARIVGTTEPLYVVLDQALRIELDRRTGWHQGLPHDRPVIPCAARCSGPGWHVARAWDPAAPRALHVARSVVWHE